MNLKKKGQKLYYICNAFLAFVWHCVTGFNKRNTILFGSGNGAYENNIAVLYEYVKKESNDFEHVLFVSDTYEKVKRFISPQEFLKRGSFKCYLISYRARVLVIDTCNSDISPGVQKFLKSLVVNVNHGMEGFKKIDGNYYHNFYADIHCATSIEERRIKIEECGADPAKVYVTGYPRLDRLEKIDKKNESKILLFLTWRPWLEFKSSDDLITSEYYRAVASVINSRELNELLHENEIQLVCRLHHKISNMMISSNLSNINVADSGSNLSELIRDSNMLITDFSSVAWDFLYLDKPVLFFAPDIDKYKEEVGLYIDIQEENLGFFSKDVDKMILDLQMLLQQSKPMKLADKKKFFEYDDKSNCRRIMKLIKEKM